MALHECVCWLTVSIDCLTVCSLKAPISMGYVAPSHSELGTQVSIDVRGKLVPAQVTKMPFVPHNYYKPAEAPKKA